MKTQEIQGCRVYGDVSYAAVTGVILTMNEEQNLPKCLASLSGWTKAIIVVDSGSRDRTKDIAESFGAAVHHHPFETYAMQWSWALSHAPITTEWVLGLDADQHVTEALRDEIVVTLANPMEGVNGYYVNRRYIFRGRWLKHGGRYPKHQLKLFRRQSVFLDPEERLDHHFYVRGSTGMLQNDLVEENVKEDDTAFWLAKHTRHVGARVEEELRWRSGGRCWPLEPRFRGSPDQRVLWLRRLWIRLPLLIRPFFLFGLRYFLQGGFLDGKEGLIFHLGLSLWYPALVDFELHRRMRAQGGG